MSLLQLPVAAQPDASSSKFKVISVSSTGPEDTGFGVDVTFRANSAETVQTLHFVNRSHKLNSWFMTSPSILCVRGQLLHKGDILSLVDLARGELVDTIWATRLAVSFDQTLAVYEHRTPPYGSRRIASAAILGYDLTAPGRQQSVNFNVNLPANRGQVLYPETLRSEGRYESEPETGDGDPVELRSDITFCEGRHLVGFVVHRGDTSRFVSIDLSIGLGRPTIREVNLLSPA